MNIFFIKKILYFLFFSSYKLLIITEDCNNFDDDCYNCVLCSDESIGCSCVWTISKCEYSNYGGYASTDDWYSRVSICLNLEDIDITSTRKVYCPKSTSTKDQDDLDSDNSITFSKKSDNDGYYGQNMVVCNFIYEQSTEEDIKISVEFSSEIKKLPKVYMESTDITSIKTKVNVELNREVYFVKVRRLISRFY